MHSDDIEHYDHVQRLGRYWNSIVCSNRHLRGKVLEINPAFDHRTVVIPYGVSVPNIDKSRSLRQPTQPIRVVYCGRLTQHQKRVRDLAAITKQLDRIGLPYQLVVIGDGDEKVWLEKAWSGEIAKGVVKMAGRLSRSAMYSVFRESDVVLLVSAFEGMPISLIEAMACGCIPVVSDIPSGIPDLVTDENGYRVSVGDVRGFAHRIAALQQAPNLVQALAEAAVRQVVRGGFQTTDMGRSYFDLIEKIWTDITTRTYVRPVSLIWRGPLPDVSPPPFLFPRS